LSLCFCDTGFTRMRPLQMLSICPIATGSGPFISFWTMLAMDTNVVPVSFLIFVKWCTKRSDFNFLASGIFFTFIAFSGLGPLGSEYWLAPLLGDVFLILHRWRTSLNMVLIAYNWNFHFRRWIDFHWPCLCLLPTNFH